MLDIVIILCLGLLPSILSLWLLHQAQAKYRQAAPTPIALAIPSKMKALPPADLTYIEGYGYVIGMVSCIYNARSPHIRCAVNPSGSCHGCRYYESSLEVNN